jgi:hypothetical protein
MKEHLYNYILRNQGDESLVLVSEILAMDRQSPYYYSTRDKDMPVNSKYVNLLVLRVCTCIHPKLIYFKIYFVYVYKMCTIELDESVIILETFRLSYR